MAVGVPPESVERVVLRLLREVIPWQRAKKDIGPETSLQGDLGIDSIGKVALAFQLEKALGIDLSRFTGNVADVRTVGDVIALARRLSAPPDQPRPS
jgi:acyl carrier protein